MPFGITEQTVTSSPFSIGFLPILRSRDQYLQFIDQYSVAQAGEVTSLSYRTPEFAATADHIPLASLGVATFLNGEQIDADRNDAFSYCAGKDPQLVVYRSPLMEKFSTWTPRVLNNSPL